MKRAVIVAVGTLAFAGCGAADEGPSPEEASRADRERLQQVLGDDPSIGALVRARSSALDRTPEDPASAEEGRTIGRIYGEMIRRGMGFTAAVPAAKADAFLKGLPGPTCRAGIGVIVQAVRDRASELERRGEDPGEADEAVALLLRRARSCPGGS